MNVLGVDPQRYQALWDEVALVAKAAELGPLERAMLWRERSGSDDWHEMPVPFTHFITSPYYLGHSLNV